MKRHLLAVAALAAGLIVGTAAPAAAAYPIVMIMSYNNGQCADVYLGSSQDDARVVSEPCLHYSEQLWTVYLTDDGGAFEFKNYRSDKCLAASDPHFGPLAIQTTCHGGTEQQWRYTSAPTNTLPIPGNHVYNFYNVRTGLCLRTNGVNGATMSLVGCNSSDLNQYWWVAT